MPKQNYSYYNHRNRAGEFYKRSELIHNQTRARLAIAFFLSAAILSAAIEATTTLLIK